MTLFFRCEYIEVGIEAKASARFSSQFGLLQKRLAGARLPRDGYVLSRIFGEESVLEVNLEPHPFVCGVELVESGERLSFDQFYHFASQDWEVLGTTGSGSYLLSRDDRIFVHGLNEIEGEPSPTDLSLADLESRTFRNCQELGWEKFASAEQIETFAPSQIAQWLLMEQQKRQNLLADPLWTNTAVRCHLPLKVLVEVFRDNKDEFSSSNDFSALFTAATFDRCDVINAYLSLGSEHLSFGTNDNGDSVFTAALEANSLRFARQLLRRGYTPLARDNRLLDQLEDFEKQYLFS